MKLITHPQLAITDLEKEFLVFVNTHILTLSKEDCVSIWIILKIITQTALKGAKEEYISLYVNNTIGKNHLQLAIHGEDSHKEENYTLPQLNTLTWKYAFNLMINYLETQDPDKKSQTNIGGEIYRICIEDYTFPTYISHTNIQTSIVIGLNS
jgi:hypothetical protein